MCKNCYRFVSRICILYTFLFVCILFAPPLTTNKCQIREGEGGLYLHMGKQLYYCFTLNQFPLPSMKYNILYNVKLSLFGGINFYKNKYMFISFRRSLFKNPYLFITNSNICIKLNQLFHSKTASQIPNPKLRYTKRHLLKESVLVYSDLFNSDKIKLTRSSSPCVYLIVPN